MKLITFILCVIPCIPVYSFDYHDQFVGKFKLYSESIEEVSEKPCFEVVEARVWNQDLNYLDIQMFNSSEGQSFVEEHPLGRGLYFQSIVFGEYETVMAAGENRAITSIEAGNMIKSELQEYKGFIFKKYKEVVTYYVSALSDYPYSRPSIHIEYVRKNSVLKQCSYLLE